VPVDILQKWKTVSYIYKKKYHVRDVTLDHVTSRTTYGGEGLLVT